jgi:CRP-like cAMP-binding protein
MIRIMSTDIVDVLATAASLPELSGFEPGLAAQAQSRHYRPQALLFHGGERPQRMFFVCNGEVLLQRVTADGAPVILQRTRRGFLAEASLTSPAYHCDAVCRTACSVLVFPLDALRLAIDRHAPTRWAWIGALSAQSRLQRLRIERMALKSLRERLRHLVLSEGNADGEYRLPGTRAALAAELGATPEALYRALAALRADGTLALEHGCIRWRMP